MAVQKSEKIKEAFNYHQSGKLTNARDLYLEILQEEPKNSEVWDLLGVLYYQVRNLDEAELCIKKAIEINPTLYFYENLAKVYLEKGEFNLAIQFYEELVKAEPNSYEVWFNLAMSYKNHHDWDKAKNAYKKSLEI